MEPSQGAISDDESVNGASHTDILEEVEELPLDEEDGNQLSTVVESPEEEVEANLEEELVQTMLQSTAQPAEECGGQMEEVKDEKCLDGVDSNPVHGPNDCVIEEDPVQAAEDRNVESHPPSTQIVSETTRSSDSSNDAAPSETVESDGKTVGEDAIVSGTSDVVEDTVNADILYSDNQSQNKDALADQPKAGSNSEQCVESGDGQIEVIAASETSADNKNQSDNQMNEITNHPITPEQTKEPLVKKKRKKKKNKSDKNEMNRAHIQGGFSSGWVGPMLQLVTSMKKIDDFKLYHEEKYRRMMKHHCNDPAFQSEDGVLPNKPTTMSEALIQAPPGQGCPRCGGAVFEAEKMQSRFRNYHRKCFNCKECNSTLDSTKACDGPDKDVYCKLCYSKKYGPKGYGFGCGAAFLQSDAIRDEAVDGKCSWSPSSTTSIKAAPGEGCPRCGGAVFAAELMLSKGKEWHRSCFTCRDCKRPLDSTIACDGPDHEIYCKQDYARRFGLKGFGFGHAPTLVSGSVEDQLPNNGMVLQPSMGAKAPPGEGCPRCGFFVYAAEKMPVKNRTYHRKCFNCNKCHKSLDSTNACDSPDEEIYCRTCYGRLFGPKGVGYGLGAGVLSMG